MSEIVNPGDLFALLAREIPRELHSSIFVVGSLAVACHHADKLKRGGVMTKDADVVIRPAGNIESAREVAQRLFSLKWRSRPGCHPMASPEPADELRAIRLHPPDHDRYFVELLILPTAEQAVAKGWSPVQLHDGWYGLPSFEFMTLANHERLQSASGIEYASPAMMALANLLSHPSVGTARMSELIDGDAGSGSGRSILRSAKDLGRVLAIAHLEGRRETLTWPMRWNDALDACLPARAPKLRAQLGQGLAELLADANAFEEAWFTCNVSLLAGSEVTADNLRAVGQRFMQDVIEPVTNGTA